MPLVRLFLFPRRDPAAEMQALGYRLSSKGHFGSVASPAVGQ